MKFLIDAGHTEGINKGVCFYEGDNNYYFSIELKKELESYGSQADLTRYNLRDNPTLNQRMNMNDGYDLYLSIHSNGASDPSVGGTEIFDSVTRPNNKLAEELCESISIFFDHNNRGVKYKKRTDGNNFWSALRGNAKSSMLLEFGFHTNPEDCNIFLKNHTELAKLCASVITKHYNLKKEEVKMRVLRYGSKGDDVKALQRNLSNAGYALAIDGSFGPNTRKVLMTYQRDSGLTVDGICGPATWGSFNSELKMFWYDKQTKVIKLKRKGIKMEVEMGNEPTETLHSAYNRLRKKPVLMLNGGMFGMTNGVTLSYVISKSKLITKGIYSKWALCQYPNEIKVQGMYWAEQINEIPLISNAMGAQPPLLIGGKSVTDNTGLDWGFIHNRHPRIALGLTPDYIWVVVVHGRNLLKGYKGATLKELAEIGSQLGLTDLINLDGGGSIKVLDQNGIDIEDAPGNRAVDTMICFYKED
jgi:hypothetical protein